jgi:bacteriocin biosynthesis cyclodehydratase domain-containing protein
MLQHPRLKEDYRTLLCEGRGVLLLSDAGDALLPAGLYERLVPLLDGRTSTEQLTRHLERDWRPVDVWYALWRLERLGCVVDAAGDMEPPDALRPGTADEGPVAAVGPRIALKTLGEVPNGAAADALQARGFVLDDSAALSVVLTESYLRPELAEVNRDALETGRPWLLARPLGPAIWIGPQFHPHIGCCWRCLGDRLRRNHPHEYRFLGQSHSLQPLGSEWPGSALFARLLARHIPASCPDAILRFDPAGKFLRKHRVPRRPQCPACGDAALYARLSTSPLLPPEGVAHLEGDEVATLQRFECLIDPLVGVVRDLRRLPSEDGALLHVYIARYGTDPVNDDRLLSESGLDRGNGKGMTDVEARVSALGEAIERYSGVFQGDEPRFRASLDVLGPAALHPNECMQFSETQYRQRDRPNAGPEPTPRVPQPLDPEAPIEWSAVRSLSGDCRYLPTMLLYSGYPLQGRAAYCVPDPSGSAAARSREEALFRGVLELVERDSLALWWYNRVARPGVDLASSSDSCCESMVAHYRSHGRELWAIDITSDIGIPAFAALSRRTAAGPERIVLGFGAHLDAAVALRRALTEMDQVLTCIAAEERTGSLGPTLDRWFREVTIANQPYLAPSPAPAVRLDDLPASATNDLARDLALCEALLARRGLKLLFLDQTRPDIGIPVIKAIVPGLRHFRTRFAPGRLYTAPIEAGWLDRPRLESELNPIGFFL